MKHSKLDRFIKVKTETEPMIVTSINLEKKHKAFIDRKSLNLSKLVRTLIEKLMRDFNSEVDVD